MAQSIAAWLRRQLERREWSQADFARKLGTSTGSVSMWLNGQRIPDPESCDRIADLLRADGDYVLTLAGHRPADPVYATDDPRNDIISQLPKITNEQALNLLDMIESFQKRQTRILAGEKIVHDRA